MPDPLVIWIVSDAKPGHLNQTRALAEGIARRLPTSVHELDASRASRFRAELPAEMTSSIPAPDLTLCAGRRTHRPALRIRKRRGGRLVVCMRPSRAPAQFDLCLIPRHDAPAPAPNVEATAGAIVNVRPSQSHDPARGVILIGGDSKHHTTNENTITDAVAEIVSRASQTRWDLTTSRRTPEALTLRLQKRDHPNLRITPVSETPRGWVGEKLATAARAWVSEDSVSMLCEAITSGCATGVLPMERTRSASRVYRCVDEFTGELHLATPYARWDDGAELRVPETPLDEADRCARLIVDRFFADRERAS